MLLALAVYALATLLWVYVLRTVPLGAAYAVFSLAFIIVPLASHSLRGERLTAITLIGGALFVLLVIVAVR